MGAVVIPLSGELQDKMTEAIWGKSPKNHDEIYRAQGKSSLVKSAHKTLPNTDGKMLNLT